MTNGPGVRYAEAISANGHHDHGEDERSLGEIAGDMSRHAQELVRAEMDMATAELSASLKKAGISIGVIAGVLPFLFAGIVLLGVAAAEGLNLVLAAWLAYLIVALAVIALAGIAGAIAAARLKKVQVVPERALDSAKEDIQWVKTHR